MKRHLAAALACGAIACTLLNPLDEYERRSAVADGGSDVGAETNAPDAGACTLEHAPARPLSDDGAEDNEFVVAMRSFGLGDPSDAGSTAFGMDLDGLCTCPEPASCANPSARRAQCDGPRGVDNVGAVLLDSFSRLIDQKTNLDERLKRGDFGIVIRVRHYNGKANDREVEMAIFPSPGVVDRSDAGASSSDAGDAGDAGRPEPGVPQWDGHDPWYVNSESVVAGSAPPYAARYVDTRAYVVDHRLVSSAEFPVPLGFLIVDLRKSTFTATIVPDGASFRLEDGLIVGRWSTRSLLTTLAQLDDPLDNTQALCGTNATYAAMKTEICAAADMTADPAQDGKDAPCDAISLAMRVTAWPAELGPTYAASLLRTPCGAAYSDDCR